jgi:hypothetical protein
MYVPKRAVFRPGVPAFGHAGFSARSFEPMKPKESGRRFVNVRLQRSRLLMARECLEPALPAPVEERRGASLI